MKADRVRLVVEEEGFEYGVCSVEIGVGLEDEREEEIENLPAVIEAVERILSWIKGLKKGGR